MNCIEKMYKEIEEINKKEELERVKLLTPIKEIKYAFSEMDEVVKEEQTLVIPNFDYLKEVSFENLKHDKKYFDLEKAKSFIEFIFKKYLCFNSVHNVENFMESLKEKLSSSENLVQTLLNLENEFISIIGDSEGVKNYFTNPYNALFEDKNGYYAIILNGKYSDVKRPIGFNLNQLKKLVKEEADVYCEDYSFKLSEKEKASALNTLKAELNKNSTTNSKELETQLEKSLYEILKKHGVSEEEFKSYVENKGLRLVKQGNYYFREKAYKEYAEYKKIEFRY